MANCNTRARIEPMIVALGAIVAGLAVTPAFGQGPAELRVDVGRCAVLESPEDRFACYEAAVAEAQQKPRDASPPQVPTSEGAPPQRPTVRRVENGAATPATRSVDELTRAGRAPRNPAIEFSGTVAALRETVPNAFLITLENGQVWRQVRPAAYALRLGHKVRLYSTGWGSSYRLESETVPGFIQVERVK